MPWEERNGGRYFYRKVREGGRVFSVYEGGGLAGQIAAERQKAATVERTRTRAELRREAAKQDRIDGLIGEAEVIAGRVAGAMLEAAGYHSHKRQWRLKRDATKES